MADTAALVVALSAQLTRFEKDMQKAGEIADKEIQNIEAKFRSMNVASPFEDAFSSIKKLAAGAGLGVLIHQVAELTKQVAVLAETAERVGLATDDLQKLRFAFVATGSSVETADSFLDQFARRVAEAATGTGKLYDFLRVNNIEASKFVKLPLVEQLEKYGTLVRNTANPQQRLNEAFLVAGRQAGPQALAVLLGLADGLDKYGKEAEKAGVIIDKELIARAKVLNAEFAKAKLSMQVTAQEVAIATWDLLGRSVKNVSDVLSEFINNLEAVKRIKEGAIPETKPVEWGAAGIDVPGVGFIPNPNVPHITINARPPTIVETRLPPERPGRGDLGFPDTTRQVNEQDDAFQKLIKTQESRIALLDAERRTLRENVGVQTETRLQIELENAAKLQNIPLTDERRAAIAREAAAVGRAAQALDDYKRQWRALNEALQFAGEQMISILTGLANKTLTAANAMRQLTDALIKAVLQAALLGSGPLGGILGFASQVQGGTGGLLGMLFSGLGRGGSGSFDVTHGVGGPGWSAPGIPGLQSGGNVQRGQGYIVGEHGAELFVPSSPGQIVPGTLQRGGGGGSEIIINNYTAADSETKQTRTEGPDGERIIIDIVKKAQSRGEFDAANRGRFALRPAKVR